MAISDDDLVIKYIKYSTARNIINRKLRELRLEKLINIGHVLGKEIHDMKRDLHYKNIKITKADPPSQLFYAYTVYKNGWRSEHQLLKSIIQNDVDELLKTIANDLKETPNYKYKK